MLRWLVLALLAANALLLVWSQGWLSPWLVRGPGAAREPWRLQQQVRPELVRVLNQEKALLRYFKALSPSMQRYFAQRVREAKSRETRARRAEDAAEMLMLVMEGEQDPPPLLRAIFVRNPVARAGWDVMPVSHKRGYLFDIFGSATAVARCRRLDRAAPVARAGRHALRVGAVTKRRRGLQATLCVLS